MPSPFPGMDPYLEAPDIWPDFHNALAGEIRNELNRNLPRPYYARLEMRQELGIIEEGRSSRRIFPDVVVVSQPRLKPARGGTALLERPRRDVSNSIEFAVQVETVQHNFVEIRDSMRGHKLITLIEILSPSNKRRGPDREAYKAKQDEILGSDASLIELDLLRRGDRILPDLSLATMFDQLEPPADYVVMVSRAWRRLAYQVFPFTLHEPLPCIEVPLKQDEHEELRLDLQFVFNQAYDTGPYLLGAVDYTQPPDPPLSGDDVAWAEQLLGGPDPAASGS